MAATRYCGNIKISIRLVAAPNTPHGEQYRISLSRGTKHIGTEYVGIPRSLSTAIDSPAAFDKAAHAALSFHENEHGIIDGADFDFGSAAGYLIRRKK